MSIQKRTKLFIETGPLIDKRISGTGHVAMNIIKYLSTNTTFMDGYRIILLVPFNKLKAIERFGFNKNVEVRSIPIPARILNGLVRYNLLPPVDLLYGRGVYLFPSFKNWPLLLSKSITYIHDVAFKVYPEFIEPRNLSLLNSQVNRFLTRTDQVITVSESSRQELLEHFPYLREEKVSVVENSIDTELFSPQSKQRIQELKKKYRLPQKYFMFLSNIEPRKNISTLLSAYEIVQKKDSSVGLMIVGGMGWLNDGVLKTIETMQARGVPIVRPTQWVPDTDLPGLLSGAVALVHPAFHEGFGITPLEAFASGTPAIVSDIPVMHEVVGTDGYYLKDAANAVELAELMQQVQTASVDQKKLIARAKGFSPDYCYGKLVSIIQKKSIR